MLQYVSRKVIAVSPFVRDALISDGIAPGVIAVIDNGIDLARFTAVSGVRTEESPVFLYIGRLIADKNVSALIAAFARLGRGTLLIVGGGPERVSLERQAAAGPNAERVKFLGERADTPSILSSVDCLVLPSRREGFGLVVVEAFASGVPVVLSRSASASGIVRDGENGLVAKGDEAEYLAPLLKRIADDAPLREKLAYTGREEAKHYSITHHIDALLAL